MKKLSGGDGRFAHLRAGDVQRGVSARINLRFIRLRACGGHILTLSMADRRPVHLRADGFGYVRHHHDGYQDCSPVRVQRTCFDIGIADRRTVHLCADGLGYVRRHHD